MTLVQRVSGQARMRRIARAILARDPDAAEQAVREHLTEAAQIARRLLESQEDTKPTGAS